MMPGMQTDLIEDHSSINNCAGGDNAWGQA